jgi:hypothetical protein
MYNDWMNSFLLKTIFFSFAVFSMLPALAEEKKASHISKPAPEAGIKSSEKNVEDTESFATVYEINPQDWKNGNFLLIGIDVGAKEGRRFHKDGKDGYIWGPIESNRGKGYTWQEAKDFCASLNPTTGDGKINPLYSEANRKSYLGTLARYSTFRWKLADKDDFLRAGANPGSNQIENLNLVLRDRLPNMKDAAFYWTSSIDDNKDGNTAWSFSGDGKIKAMNVSATGSIRCVASVPPKFRLPKMQLRESSQ